MAAKRCAHGRLKRPTKGGRVCKKKPGGKRRRYAKTRRTKMSSKMTQRYTRTRMGY